MTLTWGTFLLVAAAIGGIDVVYFHVYRFRLASRPGSRAETLAHLAQSLTFIGMCFSAVARAGAWLTIGAFGLHFAAIAVDVLLEKTSRASWGGVPPTEYLLHVAGATATGAAFAAYLVGPPGIAAGA
jgi:hypothetical protein